MNQRRRLQCVPRRFAPETAARYAPELFIHDRDQAIECSGVSLAPGQEEFGYFVHVALSVMA
jgi:hypothetical protein